MDHQSFRYYLPGIAFLIPVFFVACWITINNYHDSDVRLFVLVGGITAFPTISLPIGWWIYNAYRVCWIKLTRGGYENKDFVKLIHKDLKSFYFPLSKSILMDLSHINGINKWIKFDVDIFHKTFYPFTKKSEFYQEIQMKGVKPKFTEPLSDFVLWDDGVYEYARSISTVRYGLESSVFGLLLGFFYSVGMKVIWLNLIHQSNNFFFFVFCIVLISILTIGFIYALFIRWKYADREYDARLLLKTVTSLKSNHFDDTQYINNLPQEIVEKIDQLNLNESLYAAFDLDNTLLNGDIGEAVFAKLVKLKLVKGFNWKDYLILLNKDRETAYMKVIDVMKGIELKKRKEITNEIIESDENFIELEGEQIPIPKPNLIMQSLILLLKTKGIDVFVVTASNQISAELICWKFFGISSSNVLGSKFEIDKSKKIIECSKKIPYGDGKVKALKIKFNKERPLVTGGDGIWDKYLLDYTTINGMRFWLGKDEQEFKKIKDSYDKELNFYHIK
jgi:phosphoserine phosphatase